MTKNLTFAEAIERALMQMMAEEETILIIGEDVHTLRANLFTKFGKKRVKSAPISESAFLGAGVTAAMSGLNPIVEIMLIDFIGVCTDGLLNHASKIKAFSGGNWNCSLVVRASCGGGYGDGGQHEQSLWGWLAHIPGLNVVVPSNPVDAGRLMVSAIKCKDPVIFCEHKLLADYWLDYLGLGGRNNIEVDVPEAGAIADCPEIWTELPIGKGNIVRNGTDISLISVGVGVHRCIETADLLEKEGISSEIIDLRWINPIDRKLIIESGKKTGKIIVVDEDYKSFGLSGEVCAILAENHIEFSYARVCTETTIPFANMLEIEVLPNTQRIVKACRELLQK